MLKFICSSLMIFFMSVGNCFGAAPWNDPFFDEQKSEEIDFFYSLEANQNFIVDLANSTDENLRLSIPIIYPQWFTISTANIDEAKVVDEKVVNGEKLTLLQIQFKPNCKELNSLLSTYQDLINGENNVGEIRAKRWGWRPPWTWSRCAKCQLGANIFITTSVIVAAAAAGTTGPGALAVWEAMIIGQYGLAAWKAVEAMIFSSGVGEISKEICKAQGNC